MRILLPSYEKDCTPLNEYREASLEKGIGSSSAQNCGICIKDLPFLKFLFFFHEYEFRRFAVPSEQLAYTEEDRRAKLKDDPQRLIHHLDLQVFPPFSRSSFSHGNNLFRMKYHFSISSYIACVRIRCDSNSSGLTDQTVVAFSIANYRLKRSCQMFAGCIVTDLPEIPQA